MFGLHFHITLICIFINDVSQNLFSFLVSSNDYTSVSVFLQFSGKECVSITIINDALPETTESFHISLERSSDLSSRITIDGPGGDVFIIDDDGR